MYQLKDYDYDLPEELIAQVPCEERSHSRLLRVNRDTHSLSHHKFFELEEF